MYSLGFMTLTLQTLNSWATKTWQRQIIHAYLEVCSNPYPQKWVMVIITLRMFQRKISSHKLVTMFHFLIFPFQHLIHRNQQPLSSTSVFQKRKRKPFPSPWKPADKARCTFITSWPVLELCAVGGRNLPQHEWITALRIRLTNRL